MSKFILTVMDDTHVLLTTERVINVDEARNIGAAFAQWKDNGGALILSDCVVREGVRPSVEVELKIPTTSLIVPG